MLCFLTAAVNMGGNAVLGFAHEPIFAWLGVPPPGDPFLFSAVLGFSFAAGVLALVIALRPAEAAPLLVVGIVSKGLFAVLTLAAHVSHGVDWPWLVFAGWDAAFVGVFWLYLIHLQRPELLQLNSGVLVSGSARPRTRKALVLCYSLSGNVGRALGRVKAGLEHGGYECTMTSVVPVERELFRFPFRSVWAFFRIAGRAMFRRPAAIEPLDIPADHDYDLVVVAAQTWMVGIAAPVEALFTDERTRAIFADRDVAIVSLARGLWRRNQAMLASRVQAAGGRLVGAAAHSNPGREPARTLSLFIFLAMGKVGAPRWLGWFLTKQYLGDAALASLEEFGTRLALRPLPGQPAQVVAEAAVQDALDREVDAADGDADEDMVAVPPALTPRPQLAPIPVVSNSVHSSENTARRREEVRA